MSTILVTRPAVEHDTVAGALEARGYVVRAVPTVKTTAREVAWPDTAAYDWVAVTSAAAIATLPETARAGRWAAVGAATAQALRRHGIVPDVVPETAHGEALAEAIPDVAGKRVLFVRGALAAEGLVRTLRARGARVDELVTYDTVEGPEESRGPLRDAIAAGVDAVVFASGSAVRGFVKLGGGSLPAITIGPRTSAVAREAGFPVVAEAEAQSAEALAAAVSVAIPAEASPDA